METTIAASRVDPPWWRVALGFLVAPGVPAVATATISAYPEMDGILGHFLFGVLYAYYPPAVVLGIPAYCALGTPLPVNLSKVCILAALIVTLPWTQMLIAGEYGDVPGTLWVCAMLLGTGALGGLAFWLIVYGWRDPMMAAKTPTSLYSLPVTRIKIIKQDAGYLVDAPSVDANSNWRTERPMSIDAIVKELLARGHHQIDIGDAFYEADPDWLSKK